MFYQVMKDAAWIHRKRLQRIDTVTWIVLFAIEISLFLRLTMNLVNPSAQGAFNAVIRSITGIVIAPFGVLFGVSSFRYSTFKMATLLAMAVYAVASWIVLNINGNKMAAIALNYQRTNILPTTFPSRPSLSSLEMVESDDVGDEDDEDQFSA